MVEPVWLSCFKESWRTQKKSTLSLEPQVATKAFSTRVKSRSILSFKCFLETHLQRMSSVDPECPQCRCKVLLGDTETKNRLQLLSPGSWTLIANITEKQITQSCSSRRESSKKTPLSIVESREISSAYNSLLSHQVIILKRPSSSSEFQRKKQLKNT